MITEKTKYVRLPNGKLAIRKGSFLDYIIILPYKLFGILIGRYEYVRIGAHVDFCVFTWKRNHSN